MAAVGRWKVWHSAQQPPAPFLPSLPAHTSSLNSVNRTVSLWPALTWRVPLSCCLRRSAAGQLAAQQAGGAAGGGVCCWRRGWRQRYRRRCIRSRRSAIWLSRDAGGRRAAAARHTRRCSGGRCNRSGAAGAALSRNKSAAERGLRRGCRGAAHCSRGRCSAGPAAAAGAIRTAPRRCSHCGRASGQGAALARRCCRRGCCHAAC
jgi:hypothetical protein